MSNKTLFESPDGLTTAERSLKNAKNLSVIEQEMENLVVGNASFADGKTTGDQATIAEDIVSNEDMRLQTEIDQKLDHTDLNNINEAIDGKADSSTVDNLANNVENLQNSQDVQDGRLDEIEDDIDSIENVNSNQNGRLEVLEQSLVYRASDYSTYETSGTANTTVKVVTSPLIKKDWDETIDAATNTVDTITNELSTTFTHSGILQMIYSFNAEQVSGSLIDYTIEIYSVTRAQVLESNMSILDFSGVTNIESGEKSMIVNVMDNEEIQIRSYTDSGTISVEAQGVLKIENTTTSTDVIVYDNQVISTNTTFGNANVKEDIESLDAKINELYDQVEVD